MPSCIFCKEDLSKVGRSKEHILPVWLQTAWGLADVIYLPTHFNEQGKVITSRKHNLAKLLAGRVCKACNGGWMSRLETQCKPLILDLAQVRRRILDISDEEALLLARWTVKTCFSLHTSSNYRMIVHTDHFQMLDTEDYRLPDNVFVVGHTYKPGSDFTWCQTTSWPIYLRDTEPTSLNSKKIKNHGYKIALKLGGLFLMVFYNPLNIGRACLWFQRHIPLYPRWSHPVSWQQADWTWPSNSEKRFYMFVLTLGISIDGREH